MLKEDLLLASHVVEPAADVVRIGIPGDQLEGHLLAGTTDQERHALLDRRREVPDVLRRVAWAGCRRLLAVEHPAHDRKGLAEPAQPLREAAPELDPERLVLLLEPCRADAEDRPPTRDVVEGRRHLCGQGRLAEWVGPYHQPDPDVLGRLRPGSQRQPALERRAGGIALDGIQMIPRPEGVVAEPVGAAAGLEQLGPGRVLVPAQEAEPDVSHRALLAHVADLGSSRTCGTTSSTNRVSSSRESNPRVRCWTP